MFGLHFSCTAAAAVTGNRGLRALQAAGASAAGPAAPCPCSYLAGSEDSWESITALFYSSSIEHTAAAHGEIAALLRQSNAAAPDAYGAAAAESTLAGCTLYIPCQSSLQSCSAGGCSPAGLHVCSPAQGRRNVAASCEMQISHAALSASAWSTPSNVSSSPFKLDKGANEDHALFNAISRIPAEYKTKRKHFCWPSCACAATVHHWTWQARLFGKSLPHALPAIDNYDSYCHACRIEHGSLRWKSNRYVCGGSPVFGHRHARLQLLPRTIITFCRRFPTFSKLVRLATLLTCFAES